MHDNQFTVTIKDLDDGPVTLHVNCSAADLELEDKDFEFPDRVTGDITFNLARPRVVARGTLHTKAKTQCVRCLSDAIVTVDAPVHSLYESEKQMRDTRSDLVTPEEQIVTPFNGDWIQPEDELRESIMLELPTLPLCSEDCKGLCPKCGANLNEGPCGCETTADEEVSPWKSAIKGLKLDGERIKENG